MLKKLNVLVSKLSIVWESTTQEWEIISRKDEVSTHLFVLQQLSILPFQSIDLLR